MSKRIFISHATADKPVLELLLELLEGGLGVPHHEIFCSTRRDIPPGQDFKSYIQAQLKDAAVCIALISESFFESPFALCELGGVWLQDKPLIPILVPPLDEKQLQGILPGLQCIKANEQFAMHDLHTQLTALGGFVPKPVGQWAERLDRFIRALPAAVAQTSRTRNDEPVEPDPDLEERRLLQEREAEINLMMLKTSQRAYFQEKDRYSPDAAEIGFSPLVRGDALRALAANPGWIPGSRFLYRIELFNSRSGPTFAGYAKGISGAVKGSLLKIGYREGASAQTPPEKLAPGESYVPASPAIPYSPVFRVYRNDELRFVIDLPQFLNEEVTKDEHSSRYESLDGELKLVVGGFRKESGIEEMYRNASKALIGDDLRIQHRSLQNDRFDLRASKHSKSKHIYMIMRNEVYAVYYFQFDSSLDAILAPIIERMKQSFRFF